MNTYDTLRLKFESPLWARAPQIAVIGSILEERPDMVKIVEQDVLAGVKNNNMGRKDSPTVEQVLRAAIYKELKGLTYKELEFDQHDSIVCREFLNVGKPFSSSAMQSYISKIKARSIELVVIEINKIAATMGYEDFKDIRTDSTPVEADVQRPTNNSLVYDCIKSATRFFEKIKDVYALQYAKMEPMRAEAKKTNYELNNVRGRKNDDQTAKEVRADKMKALFEGYLEIHSDILRQVRDLIKAGMEDFTETEQNTIVKLEKNMAIVYDNAYQFQIEGKKVANENKIFSIYEDHTDIIVKGLRDIIFGHKVNLSTGRGNFILYCKVEEGNPSDKDLFKGPIETMKKDYGIESFRSSATDGGYATLDNLGHAKKNFINVVFTKVVGSLQNIAVNKDVEDELKKWRAGIEANISNLKRKFKIGRVVWKGKARFDAKVFWSVVGYNIRVLTGHILETLKQG